jgi:hypothetical protein
MGTVDTQRNRLYGVRYETPCDGRCTSAKGPSCDCSCGGRNHGSNLLVTVVVDAGSIPHATNTPTPKALAQRAEFLTALESVRSEYADLADRRASGWIPAEEFTQLCRLQGALHNARAAKSHAGRMRILAESAR